MNTSPRARGICPPVGWCVLFEVGALVLCLSVRAATPVVSVQAKRFPDSSLADLSSLLDPPAGKHGFLHIGSDGHFYFADGLRARFFGVNVAARSVFVSESTIDEVVDVLARAGCNMVRLHHLDDTYGLIDGRRGDSQHLRPDRLRRLDYWIARLKARGIYTYLDLLDYRTFQPGDDVPNAAALGRGAKPYACFVPRLIELQRQYAVKLLCEHVNSFTGLSYANDPAVALVELFDENGLFIKHRQWGSLALPYRRQLQERWNAFLQARFGTTTALRRRWTNYRGREALLPGETLEQGTVKLPEMTLGRPNEPPYAHSLRSPVRKNYGALFAYQVQRDYFRTMRQHLRRAGVKAPLTAVVSDDQLPDVKSVADELDFIGVNFYWDHPYWAAGRPWTLPSFFTDRNPVTEMGVAGFAPHIAWSRLADKPLVVREWSYCWPNRYRSAGLVEATAYALLHDVDALLLFTYGTERDRPGYFDVHADPARWSLAATCAQAFLRRDVAAARRAVALCYSFVDTFSYFRYASPLYQLAWVSHLENRLYDDELPADDAMRIASGRSGWGRLPGRERILFANGRSLDLCDSVRSPAAPFVTELGLSVRPSGRRTVTFSGLLYPRGTRRTVQLWPALDLAQVRARGWQPLGVNEAAGVAYGLYDPASRTLAFNSLALQNVVRLGLAAMHRWYGAPVSADAMDRQSIRSTTGEILRDARRGLLTVDTPRLQAVAGRLPRREVTLSRFHVKGISGAATVTAVSLSEAPLEETDHFLLTVVTDAANVGQQVRRPHGAQRRGVVRGFGLRPAPTRARPSPKGWRFRVSGQGLITVGQTGGHCQIMRRGAWWSVWTDCPGAFVRLPGLREGQRCTAEKVGGKTETVVVRNGGMRYPVGTILLLAFLPADGPL